MQRGIFPIAKPDSRSKARVIQPGRDVRSLVFGFLHPGFRKKLFPTSGAPPGADQAEEEWIGRTETMQFHFANSMRALLKGAMRARELLLHE